MTSLHVCQDSAALAARVAQDFAALAQSSTNQAPFCVALSGGSTPQQLFACLATHYAQSIAWPKLHVFWVDERCVPITDAASNYGQADALLLSKVAMPPKHVHRMPADAATPQQGAEQYEAHLLQHFQCPPDSVPSFHLMLLGMGNDGHTASLFPQHAALQEQERLVVAVEAPHVQPAWRLSLTLPLITAARHVWFMVSGQAKQPLVKTILQQPRRVATQYPAARAHLCARQPVWYVDAAAAP